MKGAGVAAILLLTAACSPAVLEAPLTAIEDLQPVPRPAGEPLAAVASTSILADVVAQVGGEFVEVESLVPIGVDPHAFQPSPRQARRLAEAGVVFVAGLGLEVFLDDLIREAGGQTVVVSVSAGIEPLEFVPGHAGESEPEHEVDPHSWFDPNNVMVWTDNIQAALQALDPDHAPDYARNADRYRAELKALDDEIHRSVARIPPEQRRLVTDHDDLGYFARAYGFTVVGTVVPGTSSLAEPSAAELARLLDAVRAQGTTAVFVSSVVNPALVETFAADAGLRIVTVYGHSLTAADGPAPNYLELMRYNARAIVAALTP